MPFFPDGIVKTKHQWNFLVRVHVPHADAEMSVLQ